MDRRPTPPAPRSTMRRAPSTRRAHALALRPATVHPAHLAAALALAALLALASACGPAAEDDGAAPASGDETGATNPTAEPVIEDSPQIVAATPTLPAPNLAGAYKGFFPGASSPGLDATLHLDADGGLRLVSDYLNDEAPNIEIGTWRADGAERVVLTLTGTPDEAYAATTSHGLRVEEDRLTSDEWLGPWWRFEALALGVEPPYDEEGAAAELATGELLGHYKHFSPSASCCGLDETLLLGTNDLARISTDYLNDETPIVDEGTWSIDEEGNAQVRLTNRVGADDYAQPITFTLAVAGAYLEAVDYDEDRWGSTGRRYALFHALARSQQRAPGEPEEGNSEDGEGEAGTDRGAEAGGEGEAGAGNEGAAAAIPPGKGSTDGRSIEDTTWRLTSLRLSDGSVLAPGNPDDYTLQLYAGIALVQADCNQSRSSYRLEGPALTLEEMALTRAMCPPGSLHDAYVAALTNVKGFSMDIDDLVLATTEGERLVFSSGAR